MGLYAEDFGEPAANRLDAWVRHQADAGDDETHYGPGHPWYYLRRGDGREPVPLHQIPPAPEPGDARIRLPRDPGKRLTKLREMLAEQTEQLRSDRAHYERLVRDGSAALSDFDRDIAHGGDVELAWASALALTYNHVRQGLARRAWLQARIEETPGRRTSNLQGRKQP